MNYKQIYEAVLAHYGRRNQADKAVEEMGEKTKAIARLHDLRKAYDKAKKEYLNKHHINIYLF